MKARRPKSRWTQTWSRVLNSAGTSVVLTVALIPVILDQVQRIIGNVSPWRILVTVLILLLIVMLFYFRREFRLNATKIDHAVAARITNESLIESVVCTVPPTVGSPSAGREAAVQTLIRQLPALRSIRVICSDTVDPGPLTMSLRTWATSLGRSVDIDATSGRLNKDELKDDEIRRIADELRSLPEDGLVVDVTGGTKAMTLAAFQAAKEAGLPVTYLIQRDSGYGGLSSLSDPDGIFEHQGES